MKGPLIESERDIVPNGRPIAEVLLVCWGGNGCGGNVSMAVEVTIAGPATLMPWRSVKDCHKFACLELGVFEGECICEAFVVTVDLLDKTLGGAFFVRLEFPSLQNTATTAYI